MTYKEQLFISEYLKDYNVKQAYIRAGYSHKSNAHWDLFHKREIQKAIAEKAQAVIKRNDIIVDEILYNLLEIINNQATSPHIYIDEDKKIQVYQRTATINEKIKAISIILRYTKEQNELGNVYLVGKNDIYPENINKNDIIIIDDMTE